MNSVHQRAGRWGSCLFLQFMNCSISSSASEALGTVFCFSGEHELFIQFISERGVGDFVFSGNAHKKEKNTRRKRNENNERIGHGIRAAFTDLPFLGGYNEKNEKHGCVIRFMYENGVGDCLLLPVLIHHQAAGRLGLSFWKNERIVHSIHQRAIGHFCHHFMDHGLGNSSSSASVLLFLVSCNSDQRNNKHH
jgi:hypothetical protein